MIENLHLANINDLSWNNSGKLVACSSDGYVSIIQLKEVSGLERYPLDELPKELQDYYGQLDQCDFARLEKETREQNQTQFITVTVKSKMDYS